MGMGFFTRFLVVAHIRPPLLMILLTNFPLISLFLPRYLGATGVAVHVLLSVDTTALLFTLMQPPWV